MAANPQVGTIAVGVDQTYLSRSVSSAILQGMRGAQIGGRGLKFNIDERSFRQPLGRITGDVNKFESSLAAANQRVLTFGASAGIILGFVRGFQELVKSTIEVDKAFKDINSVFQLSSSNFDKFSKSLFDVARQTSQAFETAAGAATEFSRQGLSAEETLKRVKDALVLTRLSGIDATQAVNELTAAVNGFSRAGLDTTQIVNKLATVDAAFAVSSKDLVEALSRAGSTAQDAGVSFDEFIGLVTAAQQVTARGGAVIGNALKSIFTRIERRGTLQGLEDLGVQIRDVQGNVKPAIDILKSLANTYDQLGRAQQQQAAELVGGVFQINQLKAILRDLGKENSIFALATNTSSRAVDEATKRNEALNQSLSALLQNFSTTTKQIGFNFGDAVIKPIFKDIQSLLGQGGLLNPLVESFKNVDTTDAGISFGEGILRGIGKVFGTVGGVPGPGLIAISAAFAKILQATTSLAFKDLKSLFNFGDLKKDLTIQRGIETTLQASTDAERKRFFAAKSNVEQQKILLDLLNRQALVQQELAYANAAFIKGVRGSDALLATKLARVGSATPRGAGGILPSILGESRDIARGVGGAKSSARPVVIPHFNFGRGKRGPVVANTDEYMVPNYANTNASAIFNPEMIKALGLPAGAKKINAATGLIPNLAASPFRFKKATAGLDVGVRTLSIPRRKGESALSYSFSPSPRQIEVEYLQSFKKGDAFKLFTELTKRSRRGKLPIYTSILEKQASRSYDPRLSNYDNILRFFPQLRYREQEGLSTKLKAGIYTSNASLTDENFTLPSFKKYINELPKNEIKRAIQNEGIFLSDIRTKAYADGHIPNFGIGQNIGSFLAKKALGYGSYFGGSALVSAGNLVGGTNGRNISNLGLLGKHLGAYVIGKNKVSSTLKPKTLEDFVSLVSQFNAGHRSDAVTTSLTSYQNLNKRSVNKYSRVRDFSHYLLAKSSGRPLVPADIQAAEDFVPLNRYYGYPNNEAERRGLLNTVTDFKLGGERGYKFVAPSDQLLDFAIGGAFAKFDKRGLQIRDNYKFERSAERGLNAGISLVHDFVRNSNFSVKTGDRIRKILDNQRFEKAFRKFSTNYLGGAIKYGSGRGEISTSDQAIRDLRNIGKHGDEIKDVGIDIRLPRGVSFYDFARKIGYPTPRPYSNDVSYGSFGYGYIPSFADNIALAKAVKREAAAGIPQSRIYIDQDSRLKNALNPSGLLVANRRDEPFGGFQGINRVLSQGGNPKFAGASGGYVPNLADSDIPVQGLIRELRELARAIKYKFVTTQSRKLDETSLTKVFEQLRAEDRALSGSRLATQGDFARKSKRGGGQLDSDFLPVRITSEEKALRKNLYNLSFQQLANVGGKSITGGGAIDRLNRPEAIDRLRRGFGQPLATAQGVNLQQLNQIVRLSGSGTLETQFLQTAQKAILSTPIINGQRTLSKALRIASEEFIAAGGSAKNLERVVTRNVGDLQGFQSSVVGTRRGIAETARGININQKLEGGTAFTQLSKKDQAFLKSKITDRVISDLGFEGTKKEIFQNAQARKLIEDQVNQEIGLLPKPGDKKAAAKEAARKARGERFGQAALGLSFIAPLLAGFIPEGKGGTASGKGLGFASGAVQGASSGALIGSFVGPVGTAVGAIVGGLAGGVAGFISKTNKSFEEFAKEIEDANAKNAQNINAASQFGQIGQSISDAIDSGDIKQLDKLIKNQVNALQSISDSNLRSQLIGSSPDKFSDILSDSIRKADREARGRDIISAGARIAEDKGFFSSSPDPSEIIRFSEAISKAANFSADKLEAFSRAIETKGSAAISDFADQLGIVDKELIPEVIKKIGNESFIKASLRGTVSNIRQAQNDASVFEPLARQNARIQLSFKNEFKDLAVAIERASFRRSSIEDFRIGNADIIGRAQISSNPFTTDLTKLKQNAEQQLAILKASNVNKITTSAESLTRDLLNSVDAKSNELTQTALKQLLDTTLGSFIKTGNASELQPLIDNKAFGDSIKDKLNEIATSSKAIDVSTKLSEEQLRISNRINELTYREQLRQQTLSGFKFDPDIFNKILQSRAGAAIYPSGPSQQSQRASSILDILNVIESSGLQAGERGNRIKNNLQSRLVEPQFLQVGQSVLSDFIGADAFNVNRVSDIQKQLEDITTGKTNIKNSQVNKQDRLDIARFFLDALKNTKDVLGFDFKGSIDEFIKGAQPGAISEALAKNNLGSSGEIGITKGLDALQDPLSKIRDNTGQSKEIFSNLSDRIVQFLNKVETTKNQQKETAVVADLSQKLEAAKRGLNLSGVSVSSEQVSKLADLAGSLSATASSRVNRDTSVAFPLYTPEGLAAKTIKGSFLESRVQSPEQKFYAAIRDELKKISAQSGELNAGQVAKIFDNDKIRALAFQANKPIDTIKDSFLSRLNEDSKKALVDNTQAINNLREEIRQRIASQQGILGNPALLRSDTRRPGLSGLVKPPEGSGPTSTPLPPLGGILGNPSLANSTRKPAASRNEQVDYSRFQLLDNSRVQYGAIKKEIDNLNAARKVLSNGEYELQLIELQKRLAASTQEMAKISGDSFESFKAGFNSVILDFKKEYRDFGEVGASIASNLENGFTNAFTAFATGTESAGNAFRSFVSSLLSDTSRLFAQKGIQAILSQIPLFNYNPIASSKGGPIELARGGMVPALLTGGEYVFSPQAAQRLGPNMLKQINAGRGYANGGMVVGGSGVRDDVPAALPSGSFVVRKSSVQKFGGGYLNALAEGGKVQRKFWGGALLGALLGGGIGYATGGKKGALLGAGLGFLGGGLFQNFSQTGSIFKSGANSGFLSFAKSPQLGGSANLANLSAKYGNIPAFDTQLGPIGGAGSISGFGSSVASKATLSSALKQSLFGFGASAALGLISKALGPKANKPWKDSQITPNRLAMENAQQSEIDSARNNGNIVMLELNPQGGYSLVGYGQAPATRRFAQGGAVTSQYDGLRPYADGGYVGGMQAMPIDNGPKQNVAINIEINNNGKDSKSDSNGGDSDREFAKRLSRMVQSEVSSYMEKETRVGGQYRNALTKR